MSATVLIVDDDRQLTQHLGHYLENEGFRLGAAHSAAEARVQMDALRPDAVLLDLRLPDGDGDDLLAELRQAWPGVRFIINTAYGSMRSAIDAARCGAADYLTKPTEPKAVVASIRRVLGLEGRPGPHRASLPGEDEVARSPAMRSVMEQAALAARQDGIVLLLGESGTGKDHLAHWIHRHSTRARGPFFSINCAALSRELVESELFGHEAGAFTGARGRKRGLLELAENGTLLLNEIGELDPGLQAKLLSFLDTRSFLRVGGQASIRVNARIFAATNRDLHAEVKRGGFRGDLYYRLHVFPLRLPPLSERIEDLPPLVAAILGQLTAATSHGRAPRLGPTAIRALGQYSWPGNIRELRNVLERALILSPDGVVRPEHLTPSVEPQGWRLTVPFPQGRNLHEVVDDVRRALVREALARGPTRTQAARLLGISRHALAHQMKALGLASADEPDDAATVHPAARERELGSGGDASAAGKPALASGVA